jgi:uroporphyrinogen decarboxylase
MIDDYDIRLNGTPLELRVDLNHHGGPIPSAYALCGSNLFMWMALDPDRVHRLMEIVTESFIGVIEYFDELTGKAPGHWFWAGCDTGEMISPKMFREFVVPYYLAIWQKQGRPRMFHMCGKINHLLDIIRDDLEIDVLEHFGFPTDRKLLAEKYSGRVVMRGGPHPGLIMEGPVEEIIAECEDYITTLGAEGGYILSEGASVVPGTPLPHIEAMVEASKRVGSQT